MALNMNDFIMKYYGKNVKYNKNTSGYQCVDLAKAWAAEGPAQAYVKVPELKKSWAWGEGAKNWYLNPNSQSKKIYTFIKNELSTIPKQGDLVVWGGGNYGHIAVVVFANQRRMITFDQNYSKRDEVCSLKYHSYNNCLGFLRAK